MHTYLLVALGSALGGVARHAMSSAIDARLGGSAADFPWGTLVVNLLGSLLIGLLAGAGIKTGKPWAWQLLAIGVLGGFTTFSAFSLQVLELLRGERAMIAALYLLASVGACLAGAALGWAVGRLLG